MKPPEKNKRVIAWVEDEPYPFIGYFDGQEWCMETEYLNYDTHRNDIFGPVVHWQEIPPQTNLETFSLEMVRALCKTYLIARLDTFFNDEQKQKIFAKGCWTGLINGMDEISPHAAKTLGDALMYYAAAVAHLEKQKSELIYLEESTALKVCQLNEIQCCARCKFFVSYECPTERNWYCGNDACFIDIEDKPYIEVYKGNDCEFFEAA